MSHDQLLRLIAMSALEGKQGSGGWVHIDAPKATPKEVSLAIAELAELGIVEGCDVTCNESPYPEWRLLGPTGSTHRYIAETAPIKKFRKGLWAVIVVIAAVVAWAINAAISYFKH